MGYYSEVAMAVKKTDYEKMLDGIKEREFKDAAWVEKFIRGAVVEDKTCPDEEYMYLNWNFVKWYREFEEVGYVYDCMYGYFDDYDLVIIGEDSGDVQEYVCAGFLGVSRYVDYAE